MTNTTESFTYDVDDLIEEARSLGSEHGKAAGSRVFDGNTTRETLQEALRLDEEGDSEFDEQFGAPAPLSGEWADGLTPDGLLRELGVTAFDIGHGVLADSRTEVEDAYEDAFRDAHRDEVLRSASAML